MTKFILTLTAVALAAFGSVAYAQKDAAGEARAAPAKPTTAEERAAARKKRQAAGKEIGKADEGRVDTSTTSAAPAKSVSAEDKAAARKNRQAAGKAAAKSDSGRLEDAGPTKQ